MKRIPLFSLILMSALLFSCNGNKTNEENVEIDSIQNEAILNNNDTSEVSFNTIFYELASPVELTQYINKASSVYNFEILNPVKNKNRYNTTFKLALNLGVYGSDLSYSRTYNQSQQAMNFLATISSISKDMGIPAERVAIVLARADKNIEDSDSLARIINEAYSNADSYLKDNDKESMAALIYFGSWIESLYIAGSIMNNQETNKKFICDHIAQQKYYLGNIFALMNNVQDNEAMSKFNPLIKQLKRIYDNIHIYYEKGAVNIDTTKKSIQVTKDATMKYTPQQISQINEIVSAIRAEIVK